MPSLFQLFLSSVTESLSKLVFIFQTVNFFSPHLPHTNPKTGGTSDSGSDLQRSSKANSWLKNALCCSEDRLLHSRSLTAGTPELPARWLPKPRIAPRRWTGGLPVTAAGTTQRDSSQLANSWAGQWTQCSSQFLYTPPHTLASTLTLLVSKKRSYRYLCSCFHWESTFFLQKSYKCSDTQSKGPAEGISGCVRFSGTSVKYRDPYACSSRRIWPQLPSWLPHHNLTPNVLCLCFHSSPIPGSRARPVVISSCASHIPGWLLFPSCGYFSKSWAWRLTSEGMQSWWPKCLLNKQPTNQICIPCSKKKTYQQNCTQCMDF